jgi:Phosphorylase superfamily
MNKSFNREERLFSRSSSHADRRRSRWGLYQKSETFEVAMHSPETDVDFARHIIEFDPDKPSTHAAWTIPSSECEALARRNLQPIPWPAGLNPRPQNPATHDTDKPLPTCDVLLVTWTAVETRALADVLTPGIPSHDWCRYAHRFSSYQSQIRACAPALEAGRLGSYLPITIGKYRVLCFKSELHMSQDGPKLPLRALWKQIIQETGAQFVITTGAAGAIGTTVGLGDVVLSRRVKFDCQKSFHHEDFHDRAFASEHSIPTPYLQTAMESLLPINAKQLPRDDKPLALLDRQSAQSPDGTVVTTDFFAFDTVNDEYELQGLGAAVEMGDAVLGLVCAEDLKGRAPAWIAIRNASQPQISADLAPAEQRKQAAQIYEKFAYWTTIGSAIASWSIIAGL